MFHTISWQTYWQTLVLLLAGYYLAVYLLYYRSDFKIRVHRTSPGSSGPSSLPAFYLEKQPHSRTQSSLFEEDAPSTQDPGRDREEQIVYSCMDELMAFFEQAGRSKWAKEELIQALHRILRKYPALTTSSYKESLSKALASGCAHHCSVHLDAEDVARVWSGG